MVLKGLAVDLGKEMGKEAGKAAIKQILSSRAKEKDPIIFFGLFCNFKELPSFDVANSELNVILERLHPRGQELAYNKQTFNYDVSWQEVEGCEIPNISWEHDTYVQEIEDQESIDWSILSNCVSGFTLWLSPLSQGDRKEMLVSAYRILDEISRTLLDNPRLIIRKTTNFAFLRADRTMCLRVEARLRKKMEDQKLAGNINIASISDNRMLLTVPFREMMTALALADSFKIWGIF